MIFAVVNVAKIMCMIIYYKLLGEAEVWYGKLS